MKLLKRAPTPPPGPRVKDFRTRLVSMISGHAPRIISSEVVTFLSLEYADGAVIATQLFDNTDVPFVTVEQLLHICELLEVPMSWYDQLVKKELGKEDPTAFRLLINAIRKAYKRSCDQHQRDTVRLNEALDVFFKVTQG